MTTTSPLRLGRLLRAWALALGAMLAAGCGGGVGTGGTGSEAQGPITGFGSVIVAGITWDDSRAAVLDDDGAPVQRDGDELRLGMTIEVQGAPRNGDTATARTIRIDTAVIGPVSTVDAAGRVVRVLGQDVRIDAGTTFDSALPHGLADLRADDLVAVYALPEASGNGYVATRIERAAAGAAPRVRGTVSALDAFARTFRVGALTLDYARATGIPGDLADGLAVRVVVRPPAGGSGPWEVVAFGRRDATPDEGDRAQVEGLIASYASSSRFAVGGLTVDAGQADVRPTGAVLANGVRVQVAGEMAGGVLVAQRLNVLGNSDIEGRVYKLNGRIESVDAADRTFVLRKTVVDYAGAEFVDGAASDLAPRARVRVEGTMSTDGGRLLATKVEFLPGGI
jgi:hypothetical protein